jgi:hypothetical protein
MNRFFHISIIAGLIFHTGCDVYNQDDYTELVVMEAYAIAGRQLPDVRVSTTAPVNEEYNFVDVAINDATILVSLLDADGQSIEDYIYARRTEGIYSAVNQSAIVQAGARYRMTIQFDSRPDELVAETVVPQQFEIVSDVNESYVYQSEDQLEIVLTATESNAAQNVYVFNTITREPDIENLTPFYADAVDDEDTDISEFFNNSSGLINEGNFTINDDQTITLQFPWIGVAFFGENAVVTNSVDNNLANLARSEELQLGGSTLPPGEIPNLIYNVEGGIGVFGSLASDTIITNFIRPEAQ